MTMQEQFREDFKHDIERTASYLDSVVSGDFDDERDAEEYKDCEDSFDRLNKYFEDVLDAEFIVGYDGKYRGAKVAITLGGPNIYVDAQTGWIIGYWGGDKAEAPLDRYTANAVDEYWQEQWNCINC